MALCGPETVAPRQVAVVGMGLVVPGASSPEQFWQLMRCGESIFTEPADLAAFWSPDPDADDRGYGRVSGYIDGFVPHPRVAAELRDGLLCAPDRSVIRLRHCLAQALDGVAIARGDRGSAYFGAYVDGSRDAEESTLVHTVACGLAAHRERGGGAGEYARVRALLAEHYGAAGHPASSLPDRVAARALTGLLPEGTRPRIVDAACASSLYALDLAIREVSTGAVDVACCGGYFGVGPRYNVLFAKLGGLSPRGRVAVFDEAADGTVFSDGAGVLTLKRLDRAHADGDPILGVVAGSGLSADGAGKVIHAPNPRGQRLCIRRAHRAAGTSAVDWVVAHGTGTPAGDAVELAVLADVAADGGFWCTSVKSLIGHTGWAAGVVSVVYALLGLRHAVIPAQRPFPATEPAAPGRGVWIPRVPVPFPERPDRPRTVAVSAFGFGGANAHLLISDRAQSNTAEPIPLPVAPDDPIVLVGWSGELPEDPGGRACLDRIAPVSIPAAPRRFGSVDPLPDFTQARLPPAVLRSIDRGQRLALRVAARFVADHGEIWAGLRERTGVIAAQYGPTRLSMDNLVRCYARDLESRFSEGDSAAFDEFLTRVRRRSGPSNAATLPGMFPGVLAGRVANRYDLHGPAFLIDTGRDAGVAAIDVAMRYLADRDTDVMLVLGVSANSGDDFAELIDVEPDSIGEGAYLLVLTRRAVAAERCWPVLAQLDVVPATAVPAQAHEGSRSPTWLAADGLADVIAAAHRSRPSLVTGCSGVGIRVRPSMFRTEAVRRGFRVVEAAPTGSPAVSLPPGCLVLSEPADVDVTLAEIVRACDGDLVVVDSAAQVAHWHSRLETLLPHHVRVVCSPSETDWPAPPTSRLLRLHDAVFEVAAAHRDRLCAGGTLAVIVRDRAAGGWIHPHGGLFTGLARGLAWDLPGCRVRAVVTDSPDIGIALRQAESELAGPGTGQVIRYRAGCREHEVLIPLERSRQERAWPGVVVAAGGARGITAACLTALAQRCLPTIWLLGRSDIGDLPAVEPTVARLLAEAPDLTPAQARRRVMSVRAGLESRRTLWQLQSICGAQRVRYLRCDVTDAAAVRAAADIIRANTPVIDLLIHAAGVTRPAALAAKSLADFRLVRDTKLLGYHHLAQAFADPPPRTWCNFGSVVATTGLPGEADYTAANEFLAWAAELAATAWTHRGPDAGGAARELTMAWPAWAEVGSNAQWPAAHVRERLGVVTAIATAEGVHHFLTELTRPGGGTVTWLGADERRALAARNVRFARTDIAPTELACPEVSDGEYRRAADTAPGPP